MVRPLAGPRGRLTGGDPAENPQFGERDDLALGGPGQPAQPTGRRPVLVECLEPVEAVVGAVEEGEDAGRRGKAIGGVDQNPLTRGMEGEGVTISNSIDAKLIRPA